MGMLIRAAEVDGSIVDVRISGDQIAAVAASLPPLPGEPILEAKRGALLPGLWDHHLHLRAAAAATMSIRCGPPEVDGLDTLAQALHAAAGDAWIRGTGYHDSIGRIDRNWLDAFGPRRPIRIQHRSGRLWILNSLACDRLGIAGDDGGHLMDHDAVLGQRLAREPLPLMAVGDALAKRGVIGFTEVTPSNGPADLAAYRAAGLPQSMRIMGDRRLDELGGEVGEVKLHHHEHALPPLEALVDEIAGAHAAGRSVAVHCVSRAELFFTLAALDLAGVRAGDRIEHASVAPPEAVEQIAALGLVVVTQPHFLLERRHAYLQEVPPCDRPWLYRLAGLRRAGVAIAAGSDAPFGSLDPWAAIAAAVDRPAGFGDDEALSPEAALALYTGTADQPGGPARSIKPGHSADLCLLDRSWAAARRDLASVEIAATLAKGRAIYTSASIIPHASACSADRRFMVSAR